VKKFIDALNQITPYGLVALALFVVLIAVWKL
jgi:hypothetical protein